MDRLILALKKRFLLPVICVAAVVVWLLMCKAHWESYWDGTIFRVQTVDFNMLHHMLPTTISELIIVGRDDLIQRVLDSNYGIFGLVVTDPEGQSILYRTGKVYGKASWQKIISPEFLAKTTEPYDLLTDPPPVEPVFEHKSPRQGIAQQTGKWPTSRVLGRIYYVRQPPPAFADDITHFLGTSWFELSGAKRGYLLISMVIVGFSLSLVFIILFRQRGIEIKQRELAHLQSELEIRQKALDHLTSELLAQKTRKEWLEREADQTYRRALALKESLVKLKESLAVADMSPGGAQAPNQALKIRPPLHPPSVLLEEVEALIPTLTGDAQNLRSQADQLHDYCLQLEHSQSEMKRILDQAYQRATLLPGNLLQFRSPK
jgi:hypothetical protein